MALLLKKIGQDKIIMMDCVEVIAVSSFIQSLIQSKERLPCMNAI